MKGFDRSLACGPWRALPVPVHLADRRSGLAFQLAWAVGLAVLIAAAALLGDAGHFTEVSKLRLIWNQSVPLVLLGVATAVVMARGGFDLSLGAIVPLSAAVAVRTGSVALGLAVALACGIANGLLVALIRAPGWLVTAFTGVLFSAFGDPLFEGRRPVLLAHEALLSWVVPSAPILVVAAILTAFLLWQVAPRRVPGRSRVREALADAAPYPFAALLAGAVGVFVAARFRAVSPIEAGASVLELALVAVVGGCFLGAGRANVLGAAVAALGLTALRVALILADVSLTVFLAAVPLLALALAVAVSVALHAIAVHRFLRRRPEPAGAAPALEVVPSVFDRALFHGPAPILPIPVHLTGRACALRTERWWNAAIAAAIAFLVGWALLVDETATFSGLLEEAVPALLLALGAAATLARGGFDFAGPIVAALAAQLALQRGAVAAMGAALAVGLVIAAIVGLGRIPGWLLTMFLAMALRGADALGPDGISWALGNGLAGTWIAGLGPLCIAAVVAFVAYQLAPGRTPDGRPARWRERMADGLPYLFSTLCAAAAGLYFLGARDFAPPVSYLGGNTLPAILVAGCWLGAGRANVVGVILAIAALLSAERAATIAGAETLAPAAIATLSLLALAASRAVHLAVGRVHARSRAQAEPVLEEVTQDHAAARPASAPGPTGPDAW